MIDCTQKESENMETQGELIVEQTTPQAPATPATLIELAVRQGADIEKLKMLMELQLQWEKNEAHKAYAADYVRMKPHLPKVIRRKTNTQTNSKYAPLEDINAEVDPILAEYGFGTGAKIVEQNETSVTIEAEVWHKGNHVERNRIVMPLDRTGIAGTVNKTGPWALSSSVQYGKRVAICAILNLSTGDDVDGNQDSESGVAQDVLQERLEWIENCRDLEELQRIFKAAYKLAYDAKDQPAQAALMKAKDVKKKVLS
jgi:ERF superfamily